MTVHWMNGFSLQHSIRRRLFASINDSCICVLAKQMNRACDLKKGPANHLQPFGSVRPTPETHLDALGALDGAVPGALLRDLVGLFGAAVGLEPLQRLVDLVEFAQRRLGVVGLGARGRQHRRRRRRRQAAKVELAEDHAALAVEDGLGRPVGHLDDRRFALDRLFLLLLLLLLVLLRLAGQTRHLGLGLAALTLVELPLLEPLQPLAQLRLHLLLRKVQLPLPCDHCSVE